LVCSDTAQGSDKLSHAAEWKIPCVSAQWLWDSAEKGEKLPFSLYTKYAKQPTESATGPMPHLPREDLVESIPAQVEAVSVVGLAEKMPQDGMSRTHVSLGETPSSITDETIKRPTGSDIITKPSKDVGSMPKTGSAATSTSAKEDLNAAIAALLARKQATSVAHNGTGVDSANPTTATTTTTTTTASAIITAATVTDTVISVAEVERDGRKPPPRLGRACVSDLSSSTSTTVAAAGAAAAPDDQNGASNVIGINNPHLLDPLMLGHQADQSHDHNQNGNQSSSQYVLYEDPEVQAQRERVLRKMGATAAELVRHAPPPRAKSTAMARDAGGVGTRTRQKTANVGA
jgi:DNA replication regulator DPB11